MNKRFRAILLLLFVISSGLTAQNTELNRDKYRLRAIRTDKAVHIDGFLDEDI
ncbi:MAG: hypothetical protein RQ743_12655 [Bacteroidales bacterium]|nr:hypothetical protein [Bacteroidales bacterium]